MRWAAVGRLVLWIALPAVASPAHGVIRVSARVVRSARIALKVTPSVSAPARRDVSGGIEWRVPLGVSVTTGTGSARPAAVQFLEVKGCEGARASWTPTSSSSARALRILVPDRSGCAPVVVATVFPDGAPPDAEGVRN